MCTIVESFGRGRTARDAEEVAEIFGHYARTSIVTFETAPLPVSRWAERIREVAARGLPFLVLECKGEVRGFGYAAPWRPKPAYRHTVELSIYLHPDVVGHGYGHRLLAELLAGCATAGARQAIAVVVDSGSPAALALYRGAGFEPAGRLPRVGYKHGRWLDTILMQRALAA